MLAQVQTWWTVFRICVEERLVYRGDFALGTLMRFLPIVTQVFMWFAIYDQLRMSGQVDADGVARIRGYTYEEMVAYYLLTMVTRAFSSMPGLAAGVARDIRDGSIKKYIVQPIDMLGFLFLGRMAHKVVYYVVAAAPFALVFFVCRSYFQGWPSAGTLAAFALSLLMSFLLGFFLEATIGMIGFWFLEVSSLLFIYMLFSFFFSGHMFPIDLLQGSARTLVELLPLHYLAYFPSAVFLEKITGPDLTRGLLVQAGWVATFALVSRVAYQRGLKRYSAFGG